MKTIHTLLELAIVTRMSDAVRQGNDYSLHEDITRLTEEIDDIHPMTLEEMQVLVRAENRERKRKRKALIAQLQKLKLMQSYADEHRTTIDCH